MNELTGKWRLWRDNSAGKMSVEIQVQIFSNEKLIWREANAKDLLERLKFNMKWQYVNDY